MPTDSERDAKAAGFYPAAVRWTERLCRWSALFGGATIVFVTIMTVISVVGRALFAKPVLGDYELAQAGCAVFVFAFLPYCQWHKGNVIVDIFTLKAGERSRALLDAAGNALFTAIAAILLWRMSLGMADMKAYGETSMVLRLPVWWAFVPILVCLSLLVAVCGLTVWRSLREARA